MPTDSAIVARTTNTSLLRLSLDSFFIGLAMTAFLIIALELEQHIGSQTVRVGLRRGKFRQQNAVGLEQRLEVIVAGKPGLELADLFVAARAVGAGFEVQRDALDGRARIRGDGHAVV